MSGYLELILGPMFSGKTTKLIDVYNKASYCKHNILVINYEEDTRYSKNKLSTHSKLMIPCIMSSSIREVLEEHDIEDYKYVLINEGQFFDDIVETVIELVNNNKKVYISGLDGDFKRNKIGNLLDLIPYADNYYKLKALCAECKNGEKGIFSYRKTKEQEQKVIGSDNYIPLCRSCYDKFNEL